MVCEHFKEKDLVIPDVQNVFIKKLFKTKQISCSNRFVGLSDQKTAIVSAYLEIKKYPMKFCQALRFLPVFILQDPHAKLTSAIKSSLTPGGRGIVYYY